MMPKPPVPKTPNVKCALCTDASFDGFHVSSYDQKHYCDAHFPMSRKNAQSDAIEKTEKIDWPSARHGAIAQRMHALLESASSLSMTGVSFSADLDLRDMEIDSLRLTDCSIYGLLRFSKVKIKQVCTIEDTNIRSVSISDSNVEGEFRLKNITSDDLFVVRSCFGSDARFSASTFNGDAILHANRFLGYASFRECTFKRNVVFDECNFEGYAHFLGASFGRTASFANAKFTQVTTFDACSFKGTTTFNDVKFGIAPTFFNATISSSFNLASTSFGDVSSDQAFEAYRDLRSLLGKRNAGIDEAKLYQLEQEALARARPADGGRLFPFLYGLFAGFGTSWRRPIALFLVTFFVSTVLVFCVATSSLPVDEALQSSLDFSLRQVFSPFSIWARPESNPPFINLLAKLIGTSLSLATLISVILLTLSLRWRFKKDS